MQAWSARTPQCAFKSASSVEKLAHGTQLPPKAGMAPRTQLTQGHQKRLLYWSQMWGRLYHTLSGARNANVERRHTPVCFQIGLSS